MLKTKGWLCLLVVFALILASFFMPYCVIQCRLGTDDHDQRLNGFSMIANNGTIALDAGESLAVKKLVDMQGGLKPDLSFAYALIFTAAAVAAGVALLDRAGRRKAVCGLLCALIIAGLSVWLILENGVFYRSPEPDAGDWLFTDYPGSGLFVAGGLALIALGLSFMIFQATPAGARPDEKTRTLIVTRVGVLAAIAGVLFTIPGIPVFPPIYKLDFSSVPVLLAGFSMGPLPGLSVLVVKDIIGLFTSSSGGVGELADFMTTAALMLPAACMYRKNRTLKTALIGLLTGIVSMAVVGALVNYFIMIPFYVDVMGLPLDSIVGMMAKLVPAIDSLNKLILMATTPFNLIKGAALTLVTLILYKRLSPILKDSAQ